MAITFVGQDDPVGGAGVSVAPGVWEVLPHLGRQVRALRLRQPRVSLQGPEEVGHDLVRPERMELLLRGEVEEQVPELKGEEDVGVEYGARRMRHQYPRPISSVESAISRSPRSCSSRDGAATVACSVRRR